MRQRRTPLTTIAPAVLGLVITVSGCARKTVEPVPPVPAGAPFAWKDGIPEGRWSVILLTLDTTRRDALGIYRPRAKGPSPDNPTPTLDALASEGTVFDDAVTPVPITLAAHATILTALDPPAHGVRENGIFTVPDSVETLAEILDRRGYTTAAFVSGFPLEARFGTRQGFQHYDDRLPELEYAASAETAERDARATTSAVLDWVRGAGALRAPYFLWVHYYDPHANYAPPSPYREKFASDLYEGEVAYMDAEIGRLLDGLRGAGGLDSTFILVVGDHGESLNQHQEVTHSFFIYDATQRVPCFLVPPARWKGPALAGRRVAAQVRLRDLAPTVANLLGDAPDHWRQVHSSSLVPLIEGGAKGEGAANDVPVAYLESLVPSLDFGWHDLRGVRSAHWKYIRAPRPELYHLTTDPAETLNVVTTYPDQAKAMAAWLDWYLRDEPGHIRTQAIDPAALERLRSLGYLGGGTSSSADSARRRESDADPKDKIRYQVAMTQARTLGAEKRFDEAIRVLAPVVADEPQITEARRLTGLYALEIGQLHQARQMIDGLLKEEPGNAAYRLDHAVLLRHEGKAAEAMAELRTIETANPALRDLYPEEARACEALGRTDDAIEAYTRMARLDSTNAEPWYHIARLQYSNRRMAAARATLASALRADPRHAGSLAFLASLVYGDGDAARGDSLARAALAADPAQPMAHWLLGRRAIDGGDLPAAEQSLLQAVSGNPGLTAAKADLALVYIMTNRLADAQRICTEALKQGPETAPLHLYLGIALAQQGQTSRALAEWQRGLAIPTDPDTRARLEQSMRVARGGGPAR